MYSIGEVSKMFDLPISTLRYYDKEGLLPDIERESGIRKFNDKAINSLKLIECLKKSGMELKDIKEFMKWCSMGNSTFELRKNMFVKQRESVEAEIRKLEKVLDMIKYKCWYYEQAINDNSEDRVRNVSIEEMPEEIRTAYRNSH